ncbi:MAG: hypothetical protein ABEH38_08660 [Flavobacteriales bacterium]
MSKEAIRSEILKVLDDLPEDVLKEILDHLRQVQNGTDRERTALKERLEKIMEEDSETLDKLSK